MTNITRVALHDAMLPITKPGMQRTAHPEIKSSPPGGITTINAIEVAQNNFNSWNRHDAEAIVAAYAEEGNYRTPRMGHSLGLKAK